MTAVNDVGSVIAAAFVMTDEVWDRHANPWSVWTRVASGPLPFLAIWSHVWFGWPIAILLLAVAVVWLWLNPRIFPAPKSTESWASRVVLGERVWLNRGNVPIPPGHATAALLLSVVSGIGAIAALIGGIVDNGWLLALGLIAMYLGKLWFCDRMVWLYGEMIDEDPTYRSWLR